MKIVWLLVIGSLVAGCWLLVTSASPVWANGCDGVETELGCIPTDPSALAGKILQIALGVAGGVTVLLIIIGGFKVMASGGDPKAVMEGREMITSAVTGLLLILFAVALLEILGVKVLGIPIW